MILLFLILLCILLVLAVEVHPIFWVLLLFFLYLLLSSGLIRYEKIKSSTERNLIDLDRRIRGEKFSQNLGGRVVISLTTVPDRIGSLIFPLISLLDQSVRVDEIQLNIPYKMKRTGQEYRVPDYLLSLTNIKVYRTTDYGPATKLLPTLKREEDDTRIIYLDDDRIYGYYLVETLLKESSKFPDSAICNWGWKLPDDRDYRSHIKWSNLIPTYLWSSGDVDIMEGCEGCVVQPRFFNREVFNYEKGPRESFLVDDIWISGNLSRRKVEKRRVPFQLGTRCYSVNRGGLNLMSVNGDGYNNNKVINYFWGKGEGEGEGEEGWESEMCYPDSDSEER